MITGDNPLTACHVGAELDMIVKKNTLVLNRIDRVKPATLDEEKGVGVEAEEEWAWVSILDDKVHKPLEFALHQKKRSKKTEEIEGGEKAAYHYLCLTGDVRKIILVIQ